MGKKKSDKQLKRDRQTSRDKRNAIRREVKENVSMHRDNEVYHILFVSNETENMEKIMFNITKLDNGELINLPIITLPMIEECEDKTPSGVILHHFGIKSDNIELVEGTNLLIVKDLTIVNNTKGLVEIIVRPYNEYTWYNDNCVTTINGERIYKGRKLKNFFVLGNNVRDLFVFQDTITEILIHRINENKIARIDFLGGYSSRKQTGASRNYSMFAIGDEKLNRILSSEKDEINELLGNSDSNKTKKLVLDSKPRIDTKK